MTIHEVGTLDKGDPCIVEFSDGRNSWFCRVISSLPFNEQVDALYECMTPQGSIIMAGAVWVRPMTDEEKLKLRELEKLATDKGRPLYRGRLRSGETK
jgi:hypothetical protein